MRYRHAFAVFGLSLLGSLPMVATAQPPVIVNSSPHVIVTSVNEEAAPPISPATSPGPMSLDACIDLGYQHQPALAAARASLSAAHSGKRGLDRLIIPRLFVKELPVRREQACYGVTIASAGLTQAESETRYAITRNFFTVQYIRSQQKVLNDVQNSLDTGYKRAKKIYEQGDPNSKITLIDLENIEVAVGLVKGKQSTANNGMLKAKAALREAMGLGYDYPLDIAAVDLPAAVSEQKVGEGKDATINYVPVYNFNKAELIAAAIANRPEMAQASAANEVTRLEIVAQSMGRGWKKGTFAQGSDIHAQQVPPGSMNGDYKPGAFAPEYPNMLAGRKADRVQRARDLNDRISAIVDKAHNLVSLDVEVQFLKWQEAVEGVQSLRAIYNKAQDLPDRVMKLLQGKDLTGSAIIQANMTAIQVRTQLNEDMHMHALALAGLERATAGAFRVYPVPAASK